MTRGARLTAMIVSGVAFAMLGAAFGSKPLYDTFCRVTGFGGTTRVATRAPTAVLDRVVHVRLDTNVANDTPLDFKSVDHLFDIRVGETGMAFFEVHNRSDREVTAMASYNVTPHKAGPFFNKLECFCFEERVFAPGETVRLPVIFYIASEMDDDQQLDDVTEITLSYTFYDTHKGAENKTARLEDAVTAH